MRREQRHGIFYVADPSHRRGYPCFYRRDDVNELLSDVWKNKQRTLVLIKNDAVRGGYIGKIIQRIEALENSKIIAMKMPTATREQCMAHYNKDDSWCIWQGQRKIDQGFADSGSLPEDVGQGILELMADYMTSGPMVALIVEGENAVERLVRLVGSTQPVSAARETLRGMYSIDSYVLANSEGRALHNVAHCSDSLEEAEREIGIWFPELSQKAA